MYTDKTVFVARLTTDVTNADKEGYVTFSGFFGPHQLPTAATKINIQPASAQLTALVEGVMGKTYEAFTLCSGITETMRLTVSGSGDKYYVRGREDFGWSMQPHYELLLVRNK